MSPSFKKRFWETVAVREIADGFTVYLDARQVMTPAKTPLLLPTRALADAVAIEWQAQDETVDPSTMPMSRRANAALDKVTPQHGEVADLLAEYGGSDLLCYRAAHPVELAARQAAKWDPVLDWANTEYGVKLKVTSGVMPVAQDPKHTEKLAVIVHDMDAFSLAGFHDLVSLSGSFLLALLAIRQPGRADELWRISQVDEDWQAELWGVDEDAARIATLKQQDFFDALDFYRLINGSRHG